MKNQISSGDTKGKFAASIALAIFCYVLVCAYLLRTISLAETRHFWIDELLAIWAARLPSARDVVSAIWSGSEYSPPTYDLFLHFMFKAFGFSPFVARLPSILAVLLTALIIASIVWRRLGAVSAALTLGLILNSSLFNYAFQVRPYGLFTTVVSVALLLWSLCKADSRNWWQAAAIVVLLFASVSLHFYAIIILAIFVLIEALWFLTYHRLRIEIWLAFIVGAAVCTVWLPLMAHLAAFNNEDARAPDFYASTTLTHFVEHIEVLFYQSKAFGLFIFAAVTIISAAYAISFIIRPQMPTPPENIQARDESQQDIVIIGFSLVATLPIGFALALFVTHVFSARYALFASVGCILLFICVLRNIPYRNVVSILLSALLCIIPLVHEAPEDLSVEALPLIKDLHWTGPIAVSDGNLFIELMESADAATQSRLVYLTRPEGVVDGDSSSESLVKRLASTIRPDFSLQAALPFIARNHPFACLSRPSSNTDGLGAWMIKQGYVTGIFGVKSRLILSKMDSSSP